MTSYIVTIETDQHQNCLKMRARDKRIATGADVLSFRKEFRRTLGANLLQLNLNYICLNVCFTVRIFSVAGTERIFNSLKRY